MSDDIPMTRRAWCASMLKNATAAAAGVFIVPALVGATNAPLAVMVYKDPSCGCCKKWVEHLRASGFAPVARDRSDMAALKDSLGIPVALRSCHTAVAGKYLIEGHVPAADVRRLLASAPKGVAGLAVPGMPSGSPGMEMGGRTDRYDVIAFGPDGKTSVFVTHG